MGKAHTYANQATTFHLLPYMLRKFNWENSSFDDFKVKLASYQAYSEGWDEWVDIVFMASLDCGLTRTK
jgi:hypothetical protein